MIQRMAPLYGGYYYATNDFEQQCFKTFWELHDCKRPLLTRKLVESLVSISNQVDEEEEQLINTHEAITRPATEA